MSNFLNRVSYKESIKIMKKSQILLLFTELEEMGSVTSKIFDYLATGRPIFVVGVSREVSKIIQNIGQSNIVDGTNTKQIAEKLQEIIIDTNEIKWQNNKNYLAYSRRYLTNKLSNILEEILVGKI